MPRSHNQLANEEYNSPLIINQSTLLIANNNEVLINRDVLQYPYFRLRHEKNSYNKQKYYLKKEGHKSSNKNVILYPHDKLLVNFQNCLIWIYYKISNFFLFLLSFKILEFMFTKSGFLRELLNAPHTFPSES